MKIKFPEYCNLPFLFIIIFIINFYILIVFCNKNDKLESNKQIQNETIISNIAEPYFIEDSISPLNIELTSDKSGQNGGLSYLTNHTNKKNIQFTHEFIKNDYNFFLPKDTEIVFGAGTTMLIAALYYALGKKLQKSITITANSSIYYIVHRKISKLLKNIEWTNDISADLSIIVSPSNPLGIITNPKEIKNKYMLYDVVYDKPLFTGKFETVNKELYREFEKNKHIFITTSFSKLGIPGVRCGFLFTRDKDIAKYCREYVNIVAVRYSSSSITIGRIVYNKYYNNHRWVLNNFNIINKRRNEFINMAKKHEIKILNKTNIVPFIYTNKSVKWWMKHFNVETRKGSDFNDTNDNSRFNLMISQDYWDEFMRRFSLLNKT